MDNGQGMNNQGNNTGNQGTNAPYTAAPYTDSQYSGQYNTQYNGQYNTQYNGQYNTQYNGQYNTPNNGQYNTPYSGQYTAQYSTPYSGQAQYDPNAQYAGTQYTAGNPVIENNRRGLGVLGAALGALVGGLVWTGIGCLGFISGWIAVLIFVLALLGYKLFTKKEDFFGKVISAVFCLIVIFPATWAAYAFSVLKALNENFGGFSYGEVLLDLGSYMDRYDLWGDFGANLLMGYGFTVLVAGCYLIGNRKSRR